MFTDMALGPPLLDRLACLLGFHSCEPWRKVSMSGGKLPTGSYVLERRCLRGCGVTQSAGTPWQPAGVDGAEPLI